MKYRAEIDGLRALAVIPVIFFHAGLDAFKGGFVGVDIFFVISGYLITTIILSEIKNNNFTIVGFYERRARRILPALFFMMLITTFVSLFVLFPSYLKEYGKSLIYVSTFISNILFWSESGYFDTDSELKPLLHTWSLAIEEQFYILFPIFLILFWRFGLANISKILITIFFISFFLSEYLSFKSPNAAFFMLPTRGWELLIGSFCAIYMIKGRAIKPTYFSNAMSLLGLLLILYAIFEYDELTPFPGKYALLPTMGTALVIIFAAPNTFVNYLLSLRLFVGLGLISYSAYLWHQPIISISKHYYKNSLEDGFFIIMFPLIFIIAYISWRFIEKPFRGLKKFTRKQIFKFSLIGISIFTASGIVINQTDGLEELKYNYQFSDYQRQNYNMIQVSTEKKLSSRMQSGECMIWQQNTEGLDFDVLEDCFNNHGSPLIILGDSHAMNLHNIFALSNEYRFIISLARGNCRAHDLSKTECHYRSFKNIIKNKIFQKSLILYHQSGSYLLKDSKGNNEKPFKAGQEIFIEEVNIKRIISYLEELAPSVKKIIWLGHFVEYRLNPKYMVDEIVKTPEINFINFKKADDAAIELAASSNLDYLTFDSVFKIPSYPVLEDCFIWEDKDHLSACGELFVSKSLKKETLND